MKGDSTLSLSGFFLLFLFFCSVGRAQDTGLPVFRNFTPAEYNGTPQVMSILQDKSGLMYFGVGGGIITYDGKKWRSIPVDPNVMIYSMAMDKNHVIYVGSIGDFGYLRTSPGGKQEYASLKHLLPQSLKITGIRTTHVINEQVYFRANEAIIEYNPVQKKVYTYPASKEGRITGVFVWKDEFYVYDSQQGLCKIANHRTQPVSPFFSDPAVRFNAVVTYTTDSLLICSRQHGLYLYNPAHPHPPVLLHPKQKYFYELNDLYTAQPLRDSVIIFGSQKKGIMAVTPRGDSLLNINEDTGIQSDNIYALLHDVSQNLWITSSNGLSRTDGNFQLSYWNKKNKLKGTVEAVIRHRGKIYIATHEQVSYVENGELRNVSGVPVGNAWSLFNYKTTNGSEILLLGSAGGICVIENNKVIQRFGTDNCFDIYQSVSHPERVFTTSFPDFISIRYENGKWVDEGKWEGIKDEVRGIAEDKNGDLWIGTFREGAIRVVPDYQNINKPKLVKYYKVAEGLPSVKNVLPFRFRDRIVWGTDKGLYIHNPATDRFEPFCELGKQFCDGSREVFSFAQMPDGKIWIAPLENKYSSPGYLKPDGKGAYQWVDAPFRHLPSMFMVAFYAEPSGIAWMGGTEGVYRYDLNKDHRNYQQPFHCLIRNVKKGADTLFHGYALKEAPVQKVSYDSNTLKFEFAAPFFDHEEKTLYSYQLEGFNTDWSAWSKDSEKEYTNLHEGNYTFKVKAKNIYDTESDTATYTFKVLPPWYRTLWAYLSYALLAFTGVYGIVHWNGRRMKKEQLRLENIIAERTKEIAEKNINLNEANEELQQQQEELMMLNETLETQKQTVEQTYIKLKHTTEELGKSIKYASTIQDAILAEESMLRSFFSDVFVIFQPRDVVSGDFYWCSHINPQLSVFVLADCTGHGVPGAFMTMLGSTLLHETINVKGIHHDPARILKNLHAGIYKVLKQHEGKNTDGMDISVCVFEKIPGQEKVRLTFAGAKLSMFFCQDGVLHKLKGDNQFMGGQPLKESFTNQTVEVNAQTSFYLFTDGFIDQNNAARERFGSARFRNQVEAICGLPFTEQKEALIQTLQAFQEKELQRDDISVIGLRVG